MEKVREWIVSLFIRAINSCASEQDRLDISAWLALVREVLEEQISSFEKIQKVFRLVDTKKSIQLVMSIAMESVRNYKSTNIPLPVKMAMPAALAAIALVGGQGAGVAALGGAIGLPVVLVVFLGVAGVTAIIEAFVKEPETRKYLGFILAYIAHDEILRRQRKDLREAMLTDMAAPEKANVPEGQEALANFLLSMDPFAFEKHVMSFLKEAGMISWVTRRSNDQGIDGFARHEKGIIAVQCKRYALDNPVGRPDVQKFKGAIEEHSDCVLGYIVTTSRFTAEAKESAEKNVRLRLVDLEELISWHQSTPEFKV